jgi:hypothetical protein
MHVLCQNKLLMLVLMKLVELLVFSANQSAIDN